MSRRCEGDRSVGGRIGSLPRYRELTDAAARARRLALAEAQELIAKERRCDSSAALRAAADAEPNSEAPAGPRARYC